MSFFSLTIKLSFSTLARIGFRTRGKNTSTPDALLGVWTEWQKERQTRMERRKGAARRETGTRGVETGDRTTDANEQEKLIRIERKRHDTHRLTDTCVQS